MIESFGCGIPVIANIAESAFRQWIKDGENGFLCELDPDRWVGAIMKSEGIDAERRNIISNEIYSLASSDIIDEGYYKIFNDLICLGYKGEVNIEQVRK
jgi:glycosyltransferase involved in cell wall biosynthesis